MTPIINDSVGDMHTIRICRNVVQPSPPPLLLPLPLYPRVCPSEPPTGSAPQFSHGKGNVSLSWPLRLFLLLNFGMADGSGLDPGGKPGELELSIRPNLGGNPSGGSHRRDPQSVIVAVSPNRPRERPRKRPVNPPVNPPVNFPEQEIENVLWIENSPKHCAALKEWDRKEVYLTNKVDRKEKRIADLTNQIFNIFGFFSVFQGVVLTAVAQLKCSATPLCGMVWIPSLLSSVALGVAIIGVSIKFSRLQKLEINIKEKKSSQKEIVARATKLRAQGKNFDFTRDAQEGRKIKSSSWLSISRICVILSLVIFTGLFILSYVVILCNSLAVSKWNTHLE